MADKIVGKVFRHSGGVREFYVDHAGPASYVQISGAGDILKLGPGLNKGTLQVVGGIDDNGTHYVFAVPPASDALPVLSNVKLMWVVIATGLELAGGQDVSARHVRLKCVVY